MDGESSATSGTATPSAADRLPRSNCSVSARLQELFHECVDNNSWEQVLYKAHSEEEKLTFTCRLPPAAPLAALLHPPA